jgi:hypothetical protein
LITTFNINFLIPEIWPHLFFAQTRQPGSSNARNGLFQLYDTAHAFKNFGLAEIGFPGYFGVVVWER